MATKRTKKSESRRVEGGAAVAPDGSLEADRSKALLGAMAEQERILKESPHRDPSDPTLPVFQLCSGWILDGCRTRFESGDQKALMYALRECARCSIPMPDWLADAYIERFDRVRSYRAASWDEVFGRPFPKHTHLNAHRKKYEKMWTVWAEVNRLASNGKPIGDQLFQVVGEKLCISKTTASEYYYEAKEAVGPYVPENK